MTKITSDWMHSYLKIYLGISIWHKFPFFIHNPYFCFFDTILKTWAHDGYATIDNEPQPCKGLQKPFMMIFELYVLLFFFSA